MTVGQFDEIAVCTDNDLCVDRLPRMTWSDVSEAVQMAPDMPSDMRAGLTVVLADCIENPFMFVAGSFAYIDFMWHGTRAMRVQDRNAVGTEVITFDAAAYCATRGNNVVKQPHNFQRIVVLILVVLCCVAMTLCCGVYTYMYIYQRDLYDAMGGTCALFVADCVERARVFVSDAYTHTCVE